MTHAAAFAAGVILSAAITFICVASFSENYWKWQAVKHKAAYWEVSENGSTTFRWKVQP